MSDLRTLCCDQEVCPTSGITQTMLRLGGAWRGRIAMLSVHTCPLAMLGGKTTGGMNVYVRELSRELGRRGWAVDIYTHAESLDRPAVVHMSQNVRVIHITAGPVAHIDKNELVGHLPEFTQNVAAFAAAEGLRYDVIHAHYWLSGLVGLALREQWKVPVVQMFHTLGAMKNAVAQRTEDMELAARLAGEQRLLCATDRIVAATPLDRQQMLDHYEADCGRIEVIPCGVDLSLFRQIPKAEAREDLHLPADKKLALFVGRIDPLKGVDTLMRAVARIAQEHPQWENDLVLGIIGGSAEDSAEALSAEMQRLWRLRSELGIEQLVTFLGAQAQNLLPFYYAAAEMVVMPSHYESFGMVALEAMASGTPVIASDVGGLTYTVRDGETGFLVPPHSPEILADRMLALLESPDLRRRMGAAGVRQAARYGWDRVTSQIEAIYQEVARRPQPR